MHKNMPQFFRSVWEQKGGWSRILPFVIVLVTAVLVVTFKLAQPEPPVKAKEEKSWTVQTQRLAGGAKETARLERLVASRDPVGDPPGVATGPHSGEQTRAPP